MLVGFTRQRGRVYLSDSSLKLIYSIAGEADPPHSVAAQRPGDQEVWAPACADVENALSSEQISR